MKYEWLDTYCKNRPRVTVAETEKITYLLMGKPFVQIFLKKNRIYLEMCSTSIQIDFLKRQYGDIRNSNTTSDWLVLELTGQIPNEVIQMLIDEAYLTVLKTFKRKEQKAILKDVKEAIH